MIRRNKYFRALTLGALMSAGLVVATLTPPAALAQAGLGSLSGVVTDTTHAVVAGATVTLINNGIGFKQTVVSNGAGAFRFFALQVGGGYALKVSAPGFKTAEIKGISTSVGTTLTQDVSLQVGAAVDTVEVTASQNVEQVQTETAAISELIDSQIWQSSPLEDRTQNAFVELTAGATPDSGTYRGASVDGARTGTGNFLVDGMDNNDQGQGGAATGGGLGGGGAVTTISPDAIQEYRVISHDLPAEYGRAGGFATDTVLKSGTKTWHGSLFEYNRIQALAADDFFSKQEGVQDHLVRNQFGGSVGGPVYKDKTFFFATVEIHHKRQSTPATGTVTTQAFLDYVANGSFEKFQEGTLDQGPGVVSNGVTVPQIGLCPYLLGTTCPGALSKIATLGPIFQSLLKSEPEAYPLGTANASNFGEGLYTGNEGTGLPGIYYPVPIYATATTSIADVLNQNRGSLKLDHKLTDKDQLSFAYLVDLFSDQNGDEAGNGSFGPPGSDIGGAQNFSGTWTHTFSPSLQNLFRAGYVRHVSNFDESGTAGIPAINAADPTYTGFGAADNIPQYFTENEFLYSDALTKTLQHHAFKAGFQFIRTRNGSSFDADKSGSIVMYDTENLVTDATFYDQFEAYAATTASGLPFGSVYGSMEEASAAWDTVDNTMPDFYRGYRANEFASYIQDDWKLTPRLTLNIGVRWDYFGPPHNAQKGYDSNLYFGAFGTPTANGNPFLPSSSLAGGLQTATFIQKNSNIWNKDTNAIGPRIGFSYDVTGKGTLAIRGGYSIGYDRLYNNAYENIRFNYPKYSDNSIGAELNGVPAGALLQPGLYAVPFTANNLFQSYGGKPVPRHIDQRLKDAYYEQMNFGFEYQVRSGYVWEADYVGTLGRQLVGLDNINIYPGRTSCPTSGAPYASTTPCGAAGYTSGFTTGHINTQFNNDNFRTNGFSSNYSGFQTSLRKGYANGLQFTANYTYSKALDQVSDVFTQRNNVSGPLNSYDKNYDYGPADFDMKHNVVVTLNYQDQWKKKNLLLGGWSISPIIKLQSGTPFSPYDGGSNYNPIQDGRTGVDRAVYVGSGSVKNAINHNVSPATGYLKANTFGGYTCPASQLWCEPPVGRNVLTGPALKNLDLGIGKHFQTFGQQGFTLAGSLFNIFNHTNFNNPIVNTESSAYGQSQSDVGPRVTQLSLRYDF
jgi:hypothetical protein